MGDASDDDLVAAAASGDPAAARELVGRHLAPVVAFAHRMLGNRADAEDVAQDAFLALWRHAGRWRAGGGASLRTWLCRIAYNRAVDRLRRKPAVPLDAVLEMADPAPGAQAGLERGAVTRRVAEAVASLPERQRAALLLRHFEELGNPEIAEILGVGVEAVESLLARGRRTLRTTLGAEAPELLGASS